MCIRDSNDSVLQSLGSIVFEDDMSGTYIVKVESPHNTGRRDIGKNSFSGRDRGRVSCGCLLHILLMDRQIRHIQAL